ncbi:hypothetical protein I6A60_29270 [Frankia sp. AgB1.9]|uniref:hypothetical protein n=1 Tax=unclassified Frankia TaxID=2632575 RepID=UPI0019325380|nr:MULTISPECIES: hypothetical protein [unclassified Frankia]MBL7486687.1 hypothetical protein [Frankia sp. AgW1.1]MBL7551920.1 hypothetical protein [Frankia sp. AgB1.9]MBL7623241.1 hypothetical protein [Frankia sp. AgB1.8]
MSDRPDLSRLGDVAAAGSRELDRVCEEVAAELVAAGVEPPFSLRSADLRADPWAITADRYFRRRLLAEPSVEVAARAARWLCEHAEAAVRADLFERWAMGFAFVTRDTVESGEDLTRASSRILAAYDGHAEVCAFAAIYQAGKLRANFWFAELETFLTCSPLAAAGRDLHGPLVTALRAFAACGLRDTTRGVALVQAAWTEVPRSREVTDVCLHALDVAWPSAGQGELLRRYATDAVATSPAAHPWWYRRARGERRCGDLEAAATAIQTALAALPAHGSRTAHEHLQERYLRERDLIWQLAATPTPDPPRPAPPVPPAALVAAIAAVALAAAATVTATGHTSSTVSSWRDALGREVLLAVSLLLFTGCVLLIGAAWRRLVATPPDRAAREAAGPTSTPGHHET